MSDTNEKAGTKPPAIALAKDVKDQDLIVERNGVRARITGISGAIRDDMMMRVKDPPIPMWMNEDKGREEENPNDPAYIEACRDALWQRSVAVAEAMAMFGVELLDGLPEDDAWLKRLKLMEKLGHVDLSRFDLDDPIELEFVFKRYVFIRPGDGGYIGRKMNLSPEEISAAEATF